MTSGIEDNDDLACGYEVAASVWAQIRFMKQLLPSGDRLPGTSCAFWRALQARLRHMDPFLLKLLQSRQRRQIALMGRLYVMCLKAGGSHSGTSGRYDAQQLSPYWRDFQELLAARGHLSLTSAAKEMRASRQPG